MNVSNAGSGLGWLKPLILLGILVNISGLFVTILGPDGTLYAVIAKNMVLRNNYLELFAENGREWLDKPHFPFWLTALSFKIFGINTWSYKIPALIFFFIGAWYTYRLAKDLYNQEIALLATFILLTCEHIIISNQDVRAEPYLTGLIIASVYHLYKSTDGRGFLHILLGSLFAAFAVMTKGLFALIPIGGAIAGHLALQKNWKELFHARWLVAGLLVCVFIVPELYAVYYQFDAHPEKVVFNTTGVSGIRFFLWDSQFGRFFNTGPIKGKGDLFFFVHTLLWAFLPWSLLMYASLFFHVKRNKPGQHIEWLCFFGAVVMLLLFSVSRFQLPHYANIIFPFLAILTAAYIYTCYQKKEHLHFIKISLSILLVLLTVAGITLHVFFQPGNNLLASVFLVFILAVLFLFPRVAGKGIRMLVICQTGAVIIIVNLYLNMIFYPQLVKYQAGSEAAFFINDKYKGWNVAHIDAFNHALEFYLDVPLAPLPSVKASHPQNGTYLLFAPLDSITTLKNEHISYRLVKTFNSFHISQLNGKFINHKTRQNAVKVYGLAEIRNTVIAWK